MPGLDVAPLAGTGSKDQDVDLDDLLSDHKAPPGYRVTGRLGQGAFGEARLGQPARTCLFGMLVACSCACSLCLFP
jgi:hypothetical protein